MELRGEWVRLRPLDLEHRVLRHLLPGLLVPRDEPGEDERLRLRAALGEAALDEQDVQALPHGPMFPTRPAACVSSRARSA